MKEINSSKTKEVGSLKTEEGSPQRFTSWWCRKDQQTIAVLLGQLLERTHPLPPNELRSLVRNPDIILAVARRSDETIIGMATLIFIRALAHRSARIEDVVVDASFRGRGIGEKLLLFLIERARERGVEYVDLTSRPQRRAANRLYEKLGFRMRETNVYRLTL